MTVTPLDDWRSAQQPSAVEVFTEWHEGDSSRPPLERTTRYDSLLPANPPSPGEQYRFEVDLDRCTGCKACVAACHSLNGLDDGETWRAVGVLVGGSSVDPWHQHVTTTCHHCADPACLSGCPVDAYEKDPWTGIVRHLDDQCIGCRYCQLTCPYEVPSFNARLGVVRKCDLCADRLAGGEAPACVQGCPTEAISIGLVRTDAVAVVGDVRLVPTSPRSALTTPTTVYRSDREMPTGSRAADDHRVVPASAHPPLAVMLVLTQLSVGAFGLTELWSVAAPSGTATSLRSSGVATVVALAAAVLALAASTLHLGRPLMAWRAVIGLGHSWLSREIVAFGLYATCVGSVVVARALGAPHAVDVALSASALVAGIAGVACSAQLYAVTGRTFWRFIPTILRFGLTALITGCAALAVAGGVGAAAGHLPAEDAESMSTAAAVVVGGSVLVLLAGAGVFLLGPRSSASELARSRLLLLGPLRPTLRFSVALLGIGALVALSLAVLPFSRGAAVGGWLLVLSAVIVGSVGERSLFFTAAAPDRMPGSLR